MEGGRSGTRVFKKTSPNSKLTVYLGRRDFVDHLTCVDPVDGVILVEPDYLKDRKVFVTLNCAFRYGREDLDILGLSFRKDLFARTIKVFPPAEKDQNPLSQLQDRLLTKLGQNAHPFTFTIPQNLPCSVTLQPGPEDSGKACGVDYELQAFCAKSADEKIHQSDQVCPSSTSCHIYTLTPLLRNNREKRGLALDGKLKHEDTNLASSTIIKEGANKEMMGILVSYRVKIKLVVSLGGDVAVELPLVLMHPKPAHQPDNPQKTAVVSIPVDTTLVQLNASASSDVGDLVFEDFARLQLTGTKDKEDREELF